MPLVALRIAPNCRERRGVTENIEELGAIGATCQLLFAALIDHNINNFSDLRMAQEPGFEPRQSESEYVTAP